MRIVSKLFIWFLSLFLWGIIIYSYQIVGFYWMIIVLNGELSRIWLAVLVSGLRFVIQSALFLGMLRVILRTLPSLNAYLRSTVPLALAGVTGFVLRVFYNNWIPFRLIMEQMALVLGLIVALMLLSRELNVKKKSYILYTLGGILIFLILIPIPL
ncbi:hypothetical protein [Thermococcus sp.]|uniref:hypothetical protein n=1 Tax=Thermococcus sp. TaxID=35749 RepID=UPI002631C1EE|nr:hypothetical protein [Thermococcus sp.]